MSAIDIVLADDHMMVREGIKQLIEFDGDIRVIGQASDGIECLQLVKDLKPSVVLLDINMPNLNGLQVLQIIKKENIDIKVIILTLHNEIEYLINAVDIGIDGYLLKDSDSSVLRKAILTVYRGDRYIQPSLIPLLNDRIQKINKSKHPTSEDLTKRELEILKLLAKGLFNKEIAYDLCISEKTVKNHVSNIFKKINVSDRTQAAIYAIKCNIVELY